MLFQIYIALFYWFLFFLFLLFKFSWYVQLPDSWTMQFVHMLFDTYLIKKVVSMTHWALKDTSLFFLFMNLHVLSEIGPWSIGFGAKLALVWFLSWMNSLMSNQIWELRESLAALWGIANIRLFAIMNSFVFLKRGMLGKSL